MKVMKLTKEEFTLMIEAMQMFPSSVGIADFMINALSSDNEDEERNKELKDRHRERVESLRKASVIIVGKLYQMESEIVESCE